MHIMTATAVCSNTVCCLGILNNSSMCRQRPCWPCCAFHADRFWVTERRVYQERLQEEQQAADDTSDLAAKVAERDRDIQAAKARILALRTQVGAATA